MKIYIVSKFNTLEENEKDLIAFINKEKAKEFKNNNSNICNEYEYLTIREGEVYEKDDSTEN